MDLSSGPARSQETPSTLTLTVNGRLERLRDSDYSPGATLADVLRDSLGLVGVKVGCNEGACGACTVLLNGRPILSCMLLAKAANGASVVTIEGLADDDPLVLAFATQSQPGFGAAIQCGFCTPGMIMTAKALLLRIPHPSEAEVVEAMGGNICRCGCYAGIIEAVLRAGQWPAEGQSTLAQGDGDKVPQKPKAGGPQYVGSYRPRVDGMAKAAGRADFLADVATKLRAQGHGLLYAKSLRSPHPHARISGLETAAIEALPDVRAILTYLDEEVQRLQPTNTVWTPFYTSSYERMQWPGYKDRRVLGDTAQWVGDEVGLVVAAEDEATAKRGIAAAEVDWEVLPFVTDMWKALEADAPIIHPEIAPESNLLPPHEPLTSPVFLDRGDVEAGFAEADLVFEIETHYDNPDHGCLDTRGCITQWDGDRLTCWTSYYQADQTRMQLANMLEVPISKVRVLNPYVGGSFGRGNSGQQAFLVFTALLAKRCGGRPVLYRMSRREDFHDTRTAILYRMRVGAMLDGRIIALHSKAYANSGAYVDHSMSAADTCVREFCELTLAHLPNLRMEAYVVYTNTIPGSTKRGIGNNEVNLAWGLVIDELAERLSLDPLEVALKNCGHEWGPVPDDSLTAVLHAGAEKIGWGNRTTPPRIPPDGGLHRGIGFSVHNTWHASWQEVPRGEIQVRITLQPDCSVILDAPTAETGPGSSSINVFACADALSFLGTTPEDISYIAFTDTDRGPRDQVQTDSAVSYLQAEVIAQAGRKLYERLRLISAEALAAKPASVVIREGRAFVRGQEGRGKAVKDILMNWPHLPLIIVDAESMPYEQKTGCPFLATFAEVEVDADTGAVEVIRIVQVNDCGRVMYRTGAESQLIGGQSMALSETLMEEIVYDERTGLPLNFNWVDYRMATLADAPAVDPLLLEVWKGVGDYPASGIGESVTTATPRAIANAIYNAVGVRVNDLPITPQKVLRALGRI
jgi:CO/xanthine dehydrogenase Mo-binding subunit/aerobic-type carbon monoxide dehydrogenase small subunit (CoxS/CutS family)